MRRSIVTSVFVLVATACGRSAPATDSLPGLGPGAEQRFAVPGGRPLGVSVASAPPYVAMAWASDHPAGRDVYVAASADNGRSFRGPVRVSDPTAAPTAARSSLQVSFVPGAAAARTPRFAIHWTGDADRPSRRDVVIRRDGSPEPVVREAGVPDAAAARCDADGTVIWPGAPATPGGSADVEVNHRVADQACVADQVTSAIDPRGWVHVAWIGGAVGGAARHIFYAASSDGRWFGRAQVLDEDASGPPSQVQLTIDPNETVVTTWTSGEAPATRVIMRQLIPAHHGPAQLLPVTTLAADGASQQPALAAVRGGVLIAWLRTAADAPAIAFRRVGLDAICGPDAAPAAAGAAVATAAAPTLALGEELYATNGCATCHGVDGHGDGPVGQTLTPRPRDFRDGASFKAGGDESAIALTVAQGFNEGGAQMPAFNHLSEQERRSLALFVMSLRDQIADRTTP